MTKNARFFASTALALAPVAFANPATASKAPAPAVAGRAAPELTPVRSDVAMPTMRTGRGSKSSYNFDALTAVGQSIGVKNKKAKNLASVISNQNKKHVEPMRDANGNVVFKTQELKAGDGTVTRVPTSEPETVVTKHFFAVDVDPKTDPDGASVRIFRDK